MGLLVSAGVGMDKPLRQAFDFGDTHSGTAVPRLLHAIVMRWAECDT